LVGAGAVAVGELLAPCVADGVRVAVPLGAGVPDEQALTTTALDAIRNPTNTRRAWEIGRLVLMTFFFRYIA